MSVLKSGVLIGVCCFVLGAGAVLIAQKYFEKPRSQARQNFDPHFDQAFNSRFFDKSLDPFEEMRQMRKRMMKDLNPLDDGGRSFDSWLGKKFGGGDAGDIKKREDKDFVYYDIAIQGLNKERLKVKIEDGQIRISGQTKRKSGENGNESYFSSSFHRSFPVPPDVDANQVQMDQEKDLLTLKFPRT